MLVYLTIAGSAASLIGTLLVVFDKNQKLVLKGLMLLILVLCGYTALLQSKTDKYESEQYQKVVDSFNKGMQQRAIAREASALLKTFPTNIHPEHTADNEGIIYSVLGFIEAKKSTYPRTV